jgi:DnaJ-class molecular chaperone
LGLKPGASQEEIKKQYYKIAQEFHPDKNDSSKAKDIFIKAKESYDILKDVDNY